MSPKDFEGDGLDVNEKPFAAVIFWVKEFKVAGSKCFDSVVPVGSLIRVESWGHRGDAKEAKETADEQNQDEDSKDGSLSHGYGSSIVTML